MAAICTWCAPGAAGTWVSEGAGLQGTWGMAPAGTCGRLRVTSRQAEQALVFPHCLVLSGVGEGKSPRLASWPGVLVDEAWGTLNGPGSGVCGG